ncbi:MAG: type II toxin-antitoxin system RelE/ParE family toxin [Gammaproteobacteria bacterium]|nr:type II toxin-antitoxin system RelE/ParE family toxin [Gammaproteobacteria bacterium]
MSYHVRFTPGARHDLLRLYEFLLQQDEQAARHARDAIAKGLELLQDFPLSCRKVQENDPFLRELVIPFGSAGYVALFEVENSSAVTILAVRHQREQDYY